MKLYVFGLILLFQACRTLLAETPTPVPESPGILQGVLDRAWTAKAKAEKVGETVLGFFSTYYEDHIQPKATQYTDWAYNVRNSVKKRIQTSIDSYLPFRRTNSTASED